MKLSSSHAGVKKSVPSPRSIDKGGAGDSESKEWVWEMRFGVDHGGGGDGKFGDIR
jgi:hypothetical protein